MIYQDYNEYLKKDCTLRANRIYTIIFRRLSNCEILVERINIRQKYRGRGYLKRIFDNLCREFNSSIVLECFPDLVPMYIHIGFFYIPTSDNWRPMYEMYYDPLNVNS